MIPSATVLNLQFRSKECLVPFCKFIFQTVPLARLGIVYGLIILQIMIITVYQTVYKLVRNTIVQGEAVSDQGSVHNDRPMMAPNR